MTHSTDGDLVRTVSTGGASSVCLTLALREAMRREIRRTGATPLLLLRQGHNVPFGLDTDVMEAWLSGETASANATHLDYALKMWASLPNRTAPSRHLSRRDKVNGYVSLTPDMSRHLRAEMERTGLRAADLVSGDADVPHGLTARVINIWLYGEAKTVNETCWTYVLAKLAGCSSGDTTHALKHPPRRSPSIRFPNYRPITAEERAALRRERERTGLGANRLLDDAADRPEDLTIATVAGWLSGKTKTACPRHIEYVLSCYAGKPSRALT